MTFDGKQFGADIVAIVQDYVAQATAPLIARIAELESRPGVPGPAGDPGPAGLDGKDGAPGRDGRDGVGLAGAVIDREGGLMLTLTDGQVCNLGLVVGRDGAAGRDGQDGAAGAAGRDGFSLDAFDAAIGEDGRTIVLSFAQGDLTETRELSLAVVLDRGVFKDGGAYEPGDGVTWAGSYWIAQEKTAAKPGDGQAWRLAVKKGRDGKDGAPGLRGEAGAKGEPGRDGRSYS